MKLARKIDRNKKERNRRNKKGTYDLYHHISLSK